MSGNTPQLFLRGFVLLIVNRCLGQVEHDIM